jgi:rhomboid protease GluP
VEPIPVSRPSFYLPLTSPTVNKWLIGSNLLVFAATFVFGLVVFRTLTGPVDLRVLYIFGMKSNADILQGEVWRLLTATFLHIGPVHLISNLIGLFMLGPIIEGHFGHWRFLFIYLVGGLMGSIASFAFNAAFSAGASGAIFGLLGATVIYFYRFREEFGTEGQNILQAMAVVLVLNLVMGVTVSGVDNWGHVGGLVGGVLAAVGVMPRYRLPEVIVPGRQPLIRMNRLGRDLAWVLFCAAVVVVAFQAAALNSPVLR